MNTELTAKELLRDVKAYSKTFKGNFSEKKYNKREILEQKALTILADFKNNRLTLSSELKGPFALYINAFGDYHKPALLAKLQKQAKFDVTSYINESKKTLWQKIFGAKDKYKALTAKEMQKKCQTYRKLKQNTSDADAMIELDNMSRAAEVYAVNILRNLTVVPNKDIALTKEYFNTVGGHLYEGSDIYNAIQKLDKQAKHIVRPQVQMQSKAQPKAQVQPKAVSAKPETKAAKISIFSGFIKKLSAAKNKIKAAAVIAGIGLIGFLGLKTANKAPVAKHNPIAMQQNTPKKAEAKTAEFTAPAQQQSPQTDHKQSSTEKIWKNYYDNTIELLTSKAKRDMLYQKIEKQIAAGNFSLPQDISVEKAAYAKVMYDQYGLKSSLNHAFSAKQKLSDEAQKKLVKDILAVGNKGAGAKKMAMQLHNGRLSDFSHYNNAAQAQKQQHASALLQLKKLNSGSQR